VPESFQGGISFLSNEERIPLSDANFRFLFDAGRVKSGPPSRFERVSSAAVAEPLFTRSSDNGIIPQHTMREWWNGRHAGLRIGGAFFSPLDRCEHRLSAFKVQERHAVLEYQQLTFHLTDVSLTFRGRLFSPPLRCSSNCLGTYTIPRLLSNVVLLPCHPTTTPKRDQDQGHCSMHALLESSDAPSMIKHCSTHSHVRGKGVWIVVLERC